MTSASHAEGPEFNPRRSYFSINLSFDTLAEWLRRQPAKLMDSIRTGSNPVGVDDTLFCPAAVHIRSISLELVCQHCVQFSSDPSCVCIESKRKGIDKNICLTSDSRFRSWDLWVMSPTRYRCAKSLIVNICSSSCGAMDSALDF